MTQVVVVILVWLAGSVVLGLLWVVLLSLFEKLCPIIGVALIIGSFNFSGVLAGAMLVYGVILLLFGLFFWWDDYF